MLEVWCNQIERYFGEMMAACETVDHSAGPQGVVDAWRSRLQKLISVTEQLKRRDVRTAITLLTTVTKGPPERIPAALFPLLRRWKELDIRVTEAANEVRYDRLATCRQSVATTLPSFHLLSY
jgi:dynein heavy chain, axonemal